MLYHNDREEFKRWCQRESPLTTFARTCKNEDPAASDDSSKTDEEASILKGIDLDNLPDDIRELLVARDTEFKTLQTSLKTTEAEKQQTIELARQHQSRADRYHGALKAHRLDPDDKPPTQKDEDKSYEILKTEFMADGLKPEVAEAYAKMFARALPTIQKSISSNMATTLAPFVGVIGDLKAEKLLSDAASEANDPDGIYRIPEVIDGVTKTIKYLASTGTQITPETIESIRDMEYGKHVMKHPDARRPVMQQISTRLAGRGGHHVRPPRDHSSGEPMAVNDETARAAAATVAKMTIGLRKK